VEHGRQILENISEKRMDKKKETREQGILESKYSVKPSNPKI